MQQRASIETRRTFEVMFAKQTKLAIINPINWFSIQAVAC